MENINNKNNKPPSPLMLSIIILKALEVILLLFIVNKVLTVDNAQENVKTPLEEKLED